MEIKEKKLSRRSLARLAAVQAVFALDQRLDLAAETVIATLLEEGVFTDDDDEPIPLVAELEFFSQIVSGVVENQGPINAALSDLLAAGWTLEKMDPVVSALLRCGAFEILFAHAVPAAVSIYEYMVLTRAFASMDQAHFVNNILDRLAKTC